MRPAMWNLTGREERGTRTNRRDLKQSVPSILAFWWLHHGFVQKLHIRQSCKYYPQSSNKSIFIDRNLLHPRSLLQRAMANYRRCEYHTIPRRNGGIAILRGWTSFNISTGSAAVLLERISSNVAPRYWKGRCNSSRSQRRGDYGWSCRAADLTIDSLRRLKASLCGTRVALSAHDYLEPLKVNWVERVLFWCVL